MSAPVVIAVVNHKGGCAKTTTAVNLASALAVGNDQMGVSGRRVLLVDLDPKGNVATTFGIDKKSLGPTMNELFKGGVDGAPVTLNECLLGPENLTEAMRAAWKLHNPERKRGPPKDIAIDNLWLLPADLDLSGVEIDLATRIGRDEVLQKINNRDTVLLDVRSPEEYRGERVSPPGGFDHGAERKGRIPGSVHLFFRELLNEDDTFISKEELERKFSEVGITKSADQEIVSYCRLSHRATLSWFAISEILEIDKAQIYDGSWTEWGSIVGFPIEHE